MSKHTISFSTSKTIKIENITSNFFLFVQAIENLLTIHRFEAENMDIVPYRVDARTYLAESPKTLDKYAYWKQVEPYLRIELAVNRNPLAERA